MEGDDDLNDDDDDVDDVDDDDEEEDGEGYCPGAHLNNSTWHSIKWKDLDDDHDDVDDDLDDDGDDHNLDLYRALQTAV